jgi:indolepyruvate ferredoxin oxidoreductase
MIGSTEVQFPDAEELAALVNRYTRKDENVSFDAVEMAETLFDDHMVANLLLLGAAYQAGAIPVSAKAIEEAIGFNGVSVEVNLQAFRAGRLAVVDPAWAGSLTRPRLGAVQDFPAPSVEARALVESVGASGELRRVLEIRVQGLIAYQNASYAREYVDFVRKVHEAEQVAKPGEDRLAIGVARHLFKLMAYKDEYEVARLHLADGFSRELARRYPGGVRVEYHLHPPMLRGLGFRKKLRFGRWITRVLRLLVALRGLRGTFVDVFGYTQVRRLERALIGEYRALIQKALVGLSRESYERAVALADLPELIRGYEEVKLRSVERFREEVRKLDG